MDANAVGLVAVLYMATMIANRLCGMFLEYIAYVGVWQSVFFVVPLVIVLSLIPIMVKQLRDS